MLVVFDIDEVYEQPPHLAGILALCEVRQIANFLWHFSAASACRILPLLDSLNPIITMPDSLNQIVHLEFARIQASRLELL
mmetsp:Transcript_34142/g.83141  ORF Transcript_34142/g.83141 Transcript_34142/m.83141 type:complete len:81 (-) Transcript_34142:508-750(-)